MSATTRNWFPLLGLPLLLMLASCGDNGGSAFGYTGGGGGGGGGGGAGAGDPSAPPVGARPVRGNPQVVDVQPSGNTPVALSSPIAITFSETVNASTINTTNITVRTVGSVTPIPGNFLVLAGGQFAIFLAQGDLPASSQIEVVGTVDVLDLDGNRLKVPSEGVIGSFETVAGGASPAPLVVATYPPAEPTVAASAADNFPSETDVVVVWSRPIDTGTIFPAGFLLGTADTTTPTPPLPFSLTAVLGLQDLDVSYPLQAGNRVGVYVPKLPLDTGQSIGVVVTPAVAGSGGQAQGDLFFGVFETLAFRAPILLTVHSTPPSTVNLGNRQALDVSVELDATALVDDEVVLLIQERSGPASVLFSLPVTVSGAQVVDFLGLDLTDSSGANLLAEGPLTIGAYLERNKIFTQYIVGDLNQDTVAPAVLSLGPPIGTSQQAFLTTLETPAIYGTTSEPVASVEVSFTGPPAAPATTPLIRDGNFFVLEPVDFGRLSTPRDLQFVLTDAAGNQSNPQNATIAQRGLVTGDTSTGQLVVQVYDAATFAPEVQVDVSIEEGAPGSMPGSEQIGLTDTQGQVSFTVTPGARHSITVHAVGSNLTSILDTGAGFVSLPLEGTVSGNSTITGTIGQSVGSFGGIEDIRLGVNLAMDALSLGLADIEDPTGVSVPIPSMGVAANRLIYLTAFRTFFPVGAGSPISFYEEAPGTPPVAAGAARNVALNFPPTPPVAVPWGPLTVDFSAILNPANFASNLAAPPQVSVVSAVRGFDGAPVFGIGGASGTAPNYTVAGSLVAPGLGPALIDEAYYVVQAVDNLGNVSRGRPTLALGGVLGSVPMPPLPSLTSGPGPYAFPFSFSFADSLPGSGLYRVRFTDGDPFLPRSWTVFIADGGGATVTATMPALPPPLTNLTLGTWSVSIDAVGMPAGFSADDFSLSELARSQNSFARPAIVGITVTQND